MLLECERLQSGKTADIDPKKPIIILEAEVTVDSDSLKFNWLMVQLNVSNILGYYRNLGSLRYGTSTAS